MILPARVRAAEKRPLDQEPSPMPLKLHSDELPTINLTSMIDVLFLLIIFFMVGTQFTTSESSIQVNLSKTSQPTTIMTGPAPRVVSLFSDGNVELDGQRITPSQLTATLAAAVQSYPGLSVQFKPDASCSVRQAVEVHEAIIRSGAAKIAWATAAARMPGSVQR